MDSIPSKAVNNLALALQDVSEKLMENNKIGIQEAYTGYMHGVGKIWRAYLDKNLDSASAWKATKEAQKVITHLHRLGGKGAPNYFDSLRMLYDLMEIQRSWGQYQKALLYMDTIQGISKDGDIAIAQRWDCLLHIEWKISKGAITRLEGIRQIDSCARMETFNKLDSTSKSRLALKIQQSPIALAAKKALIKVFPNPGTTQISILSEDHMLNNTFNYEIYDAQGKKAEVGMIFFREGLSNSINVTGLRSGIYHIIISMNQEKVSTSFSITR